MLRKEVSARFVNIDHDSPMLLLLDLRDWVAADHRVHFIIDTVQALDISLALTNQRGTTHAQYPPSMMLGLLIDCYATGTFSSRRTETLTHENDAVHFLTGDTHPNHDSICKSRRENKDLLASSFHQVLELAARVKVLQAKVAMDARAKERLIEEQAAYQEKLATRQAKEQTISKKPPGKAPQPPQEGPRDKHQYNFTDPESRLMKVRGGYEQSYNAQATFEVTTMLIVAAHVTDQANDKQQLVPTLAVVSPVIPQVTNVHVDSGYYSKNAILTVESTVHPHHLRRHETSAPWSQHRPARSPRRPTTAATRYPVRRANDPPVRNHLR